MTTTVQHPGAPEAPLVVEIRAGRLLAPIEADRDCDTISFVLDVAPRYPKTLSGQPNFSTRILVTAGQPLAGHLLASNLEKGDVMFAQGPAWTGRHGLMMRARNAGLSALDAPLPLDGETA